MSVLTDSYVVSENQDLFHALKDGVDYFDAVLVNENETGIQFNDHFFSNYSGVYRLTAPLTQLLKHLDYNFTFYMASPILYNSIVGGSKKALKWIFNRTFEQVTAPALKKLNSDLNIPDLLRLSSDSIELPGALLLNLPEDFVVDYEFLRTYTPEHLSFFTDTDLDISFLRPRVRISRFDNNKIEIDSLINDIKNSTLSLYHKEGYKLVDWSGSVAPNNLGWTRRLRISINDKSLKLWEDLLSLDGVVCNMVPSHRPSPEVSQYLIENGQFVFNVTVYWSRVNPMVTVSLDGDMIINRRSLKTGGDFNRSLTDFVETLREVMDKENHNHIPLV